MLGGAGYVAYKAGKNAQQQQYHDADQDAQLAEVQQQQAETAAQPPPPYPPPAPAAASPEDSAAQRIEALTRLKELLDAGVLTPEEFDAQKQKLLQS
jgi:hypothetical protein